MSDVFTDIEDSKPGNKLAPVVSRNNWYWLRKCCCRLDFLRCQTSGWLWIAGFYVSHSFSGLYRKTLIGLQKPNAIPLCLLNECEK